MPSMTLTETLQKNTIKLSEKILVFEYCLIHAKYRPPFCPFKVVRVTVRFRLIDFNFAPFII